MKKTLKISRQEESDICLSCGECCKRYWITVLPEEAVKIARLQKKQQKDFLQNDCILYVKLYPKSTPGVLTYPSTFFPKRIIDLIKKSSPIVSESFFVVPQIVLKRQEKTVFNFTGGRTKTEKRNTCIFLSPENNCAIYEARPGPCKLFPFIAVPGFREQYPFCELFKQTEKDLGIESKLYYQKVQSYFKKVYNFGFEYIWRCPSTRGQLYLQDTYLGEISLEELTQMMPSKD